MPPRRRAPTAARRGRATILAALVVVSVALMSFLVEGSSGTSGDDTRATPTITMSTPQPAPSGLLAAGFPDQMPRDQQGALGEADGVVPDGVTVFDDEFSAVAKLDPALLGALRHAATEAQRDRVTFYVDSGWRSRKYQEQLLQAAIAKYGSEAEAARWVATPDASAHVSGGAVDVGPFAATAWLAKHGATYGLCPIYRNEAWHYELRREAVDLGCPPMYADPTHDPRMQR